MDPNEFTNNLRRLQRDFDTKGISFANTECTGLSNCTFCLFSQGLVSCYSCTHSSKCEESAYLTHCHGCRYCHHCSYCHDSEHCTHSAYLNLCSWSNECNYCFGCVGLYKKDFHILNEPYPRNEYFNIVKRLQRELGLGGGKVAP